MATPASVAKHPIHPMLVPFPIGLWIFSLICDLGYAFGWGGPFWKDVAFVSMAGGIIGALLAAIPGYVDYRSLTAPNVQRIAQWHLIINLSLVVLFAVNLSLRTGHEMGGSLPVVLSFVGVAMLGISGWLGGELVYVRGVAVESQESITLKGPRRAA
jgi:uncharacterized membrane protein